MRTEQLKRALATIRKPGFRTYLAGYSSHPEWELKKFSISGREVFFGYYDKRQLSLDNQRLLAGTVDSQLARQKEPKGQMDVGWFNVENGDFRKVASTSAFNWQQGCMLRWVPETGDRQIAFNDFRDGKFVTIVVDTEKGEEIATRPYASYDISPSGETIATCNFSRLHRCRLGYGYWQNSTCSTPDAPTSEDSELIRLFNARTDELNRSIRVKDVHNALQRTVPSEHLYVNHLTFSPDSKNLIFLVFWQENGTEKMASLVSDLTTGQLIVLTQKYMSHFCWETNDRIVAWGEANCGTSAYFRYHLSDGRQVLYWSEKGLSDGHCTIAADGTLLTDTYPNSQGLQTLMTRHENGRVTKLAEFHSPARFAFDLRCDLHPRLTAKRDCYSLDSASGGHRSTYLISRKPGKHTGV